MPSKGPGSISAASDLQIGQRVIVALQRSALLAHSLQKSRLSWSGQPSYGRSVHAVRPRDVSLGLPSIEAGQRLRPLESGELSRATKLHASLLRSLPAF